MEFLIHASTEKGHYRSSNQDSICMKLAEWDGKQVAMAIVCDGMGGLAKGELASATVAKSFERWFELQLPPSVGTLSLEEIGSHWVSKLQDISEKIKRYSVQNGILQGIGTTFSGMLFWGNEYVMVHVGDTRIYQIRSEAVQLTTDHTLVAKEIAAGRMTVEEAAHSPNRNKLLQCIGASKWLEPECKGGRVFPGDVFLLCSDGFRHKLKPQEMYACFGNGKVTGKNMLERTCSSLIHKAMERGEKDNISVAIVKAS